MPKKQSATLWMQQAKPSKAQAANPNSKKHNGANIF